MPDVKFSEQGRRPGDFMGVQDRIEGRHEWAIVLDNSGAGNTFAPERPHYEVWVNRQLMVTCHTSGEAQSEMQEYLSGRRHIPG
ncbi:MAG: hypothetical protein QM692_21820 [Thermomicrobiales bacterium]